MKFNLILWSIFVMTQLFLATSCASKVQQVDSSLIATQDLKGHIGSREVGIKDGNVLVQEKVAADDELRITENVNLNKRLELESEEYALNQCNKSLAMAQGISKLPAVIKHDIWSESQREEKLGLAGEENSLVIVKTSDFKVQLAQARKDRISYEKAISSVTRMKEECEFKLQSTKAKATTQTSRSAVTQPVQQEAQMYDERG